MINRRKLREIGEKTQGGETVGMTVRQLLALFGASRRGYLVERFVEKELRKQGLEADPSFKMPRAYDQMVWLVAREGREDQTPGVSQEFP